MKRALILDVNNSLMGGSIEPTYLLSLTAYLLENGQFSNALRVMYYFGVCSGAYLRGRPLTSLITLYAKALMGTRQDVLMEKVSPARYDTGLWYLASKIPIGGILRVPRPISPIAGIILEASRSNVKTAILSCSLGDLLDSWLDHYSLTVDALLVNELVYDAMECVSGLKMNVVPSRKIEALLRLVKKLRVTLDEVVYFGDDEHDMGPILLIKDVGGAAVLSPLASDKVREECRKKGIDTPMNFNEAHDILCSELFPYWKSR